MKLEFPETRKIPCVIAATMLSCDDFVEVWGKVPRIEDDFWLDNVFHAHSYDNEVPVDKHILNTLLENTKEYNYDVQGIASTNPEAFEYFMDISSESKVVSPNPTSCWRTTIRSASVREKAGLRPVLIIDSDLKAKDKFYFGGHTFTVVSKKYAISDDVLGHYTFKKAKEKLDEWFEKEIARYPSPQMMNNIKKQQECDGMMEETER